MLDARVSMTTDGDGTYWRNRRIGQVVSESMMGVWGA